MALALDLANQFGDTGLKRLATAAVGSGGAATEATLRANLAEEARKKVLAKFPKEPEYAKGRKDRSDFLLTTTLLSDSLFTP